MDLLGWDSCDFILVCGDAYIDHPLIPYFIAAHPGTSDYDMMNLAI